MRLRRTFVTRSFAALLLCLTASPVTAPFTTCDLSDFLHHHRSDAPSPGHQLAIPGKIAPDVNASPIVAALRAIPCDIDVACQSSRSTAVAHDSTRLQTVLRI